MATGERYRVLVVDDEEDMRTLLQMALSEVYDVVTATNGLDAMLKLPRYQPDLAVVDIMMPLMNGLDLAVRIRQTPGYQDLPIIALSALNSRDDIRKGYEAGADLYLTKPFQPDRVIKNVAFSLQNRPVRHKDLTMAQVEEREARLAEMTKRALERKAAPPAPAPVSATKPLTVRVPTPAPPSTAPKGTPIPMEELTAAPPLAPKSPAAPAPPAAARRRVDSGDERIREHEPAFWSESEAGEDFDAVPLRARILMVDDDADFLVITRQILEEEFEVVTAEDGLEAMAKVPDVQPDIFIIDGMMPKMSGYQLVEMLRGTMETRALPIVFASAKGSERDKKMMFQKGVDRYLVKPFPTRELLITLHEIAGQPGFHVRSKRRSIRDILYDEGKRRAEAVAHVDKTKRWETYGALEGFLKETRRKDSGA